MARGPKKHMKRIATPHSWMLSKLGGKWATRPSTGPHKLRESLPLAIVIQNRLKYALNGREVKLILNDKEGLVKVDNKLRKDHGFPTGLMDVITLEKTKENFRVLYDVKGRFILKKIKAEEAKFKLCKVRSRALGPNKIPYIVTHDGRTIRYPDPKINVGDSIKLDLIQNKIIDILPFEIGNTVYLQSGNNIGRVGTLTAVDSHPGSFDIVHVKDVKGVSFSTRISNAFIIGLAKAQPVISLPKDNGVYLTAIEKKIQLESKN